MPGFLLRVSVDRIMPLVSNTKKCISLWKDRDIIVAESDLCWRAETIILISLVIQIYLTIQMSDWIKETSLLAVAAC